MSNQVFLQSSYHPGMYLYDSFHGIYMVFADILQKFENFITIRGVVETKKTFLSSYQVILQTAIGTKIINKM